MQIEIKSLLDTPYYKTVRCDNSEADVIENVWKYVENYKKKFYSIQ